MVSTVLGVSVLSFKGDKVVKEVSTSRFWFKEGCLVAKFDRFEQGLHQRVFFDLFTQGFSVKVLLSLRILSTGTSSMQVLHGFEFEEKPLGDHTFKVEPQENVNQGAGLQEVQTQDLMDYQLARDREQHLACEIFGYREDSNEAAFAVVVVEKIYAHESLTFNNTVACEAKIWVTKGLLVKAKGNILGLEITRDQSGNTLRVSQSKIHNKKLVQTLLKGHSTLSLDDSLSGDCDVEKNGKWSCIYTVGSQEYQMVCTRLDIASADVRYELMILGCAGSLKANLQHIEALSTTEAGYMTFTEAWKKEI
ncbi:hypothetical protein Tco_0553197 [Tanacetum coccineum]